MINSCPVFRIAQLCAKYCFWWFPPTTNCLNYGRHESSYKFARVHGHADSNFLNTRTRYLRKITPPKVLCAKCYFLRISANNWLVKLTQARVRSLTNQWFWWLAVFAFSSKSINKWLFLCYVKCQNERIFVWLLLFCPMLAAILFSG